MTHVYGLKFDGSNRIACIDPGRVLIVTNCGKLEPGTVEKVRPSKETPGLVLDFTSPESIQVMVDALLKAKAALLLCQVADLIDAKLGENDDPEREADSGVERGSSSDNLEAGEGGAPTAN